MILLNPKMDMQKIVTLDGFGVRADPRDHFGKKRYQGHYLPRFAVDNYFQGVLT